MNRKDKKNQSKVCRIVFLESRRTFSETRRSHFMGDFGTTILNLHIIIIHQIEGLFTNLQTIQWNKLEKD